MNEAIELHDSKLTEISCRDGAVVVSLSAYIHRSAGVPGRDAGTGWMQMATLTFPRASPVEPGAGLPLWVSDGSLRVGATRHENIIPASGRFDGEVEFSVVLENVETVTVRGRGVCIELHGDARFVEKVSF